MSHQAAYVRGHAERFAPEGFAPEPVHTSGGPSGWRVKVPGGRALATPAVVGGRIYLGGGFGSHEFYALDAGTGLLAWALRLSDDGPSAAVVARGRVVFTTESCTLFVLDAATGEHCWSHWLGDPLLAQPAVHRGVVYVSFPRGLAGHCLAAFTLEQGHELWQVPIPGDVITAPVVSGDSVYFTTFDGTVHRHRLADGSRVWARAMGASSAPTVHREEVLVAQARHDARQSEEGFSTVDRSGVVSRHMDYTSPAPWLRSEVQEHSSYGDITRVSDASVGFGAGPPPTAKAQAAAATVGQRTVRGLWEYQGSRPTVVRGVSYTTHGSRVRAARAGASVPMWEHELAGEVANLGGHLGSPPACAGGKTVLGTATGEIIGLDAASGQSMFRFSVGEPIRFQPALVRGVVYVGTAQGSLFAFDVGDQKVDGWPMWGGSPEHNGPTDEAERVVA